jgi:hypothetical protein
MQDPRSIAVTRWPFSYPQLSDDNEIARTSKSRWLYKVKTTNCHDAANLASVRTASVDEAVGDVSYVAAVW